MEILGLDILQGADGREVVLECNGSSIGLTPRHRAEDVGHIVELLRGAASTASAAITATAHANAVRAAVRSRADAWRLRCADVLAAVREFHAQLSASSHVPLIALHARKQLHGPNQLRLAQQVAVVWLLLVLLGAPPPAAEVAFCASSSYAALAAVPGLLEALSELEVGNTLELMAELGLLERTQPLH